MDSTGVQQAGDVQGLGRPGKIATGSEAMKRIAIASLASLVVLTLCAESATAAPKGKDSDKSASEEKEESKTEEKEEDASGDEEDASAGEGGTSNDETEGRVSSSGGGRKAASIGAAAPAVIGFGPGFFWEETTDIDTQRANGSQESETREDVVSDGFFTLQLWTLVPMFSERVRVGGGLAWFNKYTVLPADEEDPNDDDYVEYGHTFHLFGQGEYIIPRVIAKASILFGLRAGAIVVFPGGSADRDLGPQIDRRKNEGYSIWPGPKGGAFAAPAIGALWPLNDKINARFDASIQFAKTWLINAEAEAGGSLLERERILNTTRYMFLFGLELGL